MKSLSLVSNKAGIAEFKRVCKAMAKKTILNAMQIYFGSVTKRYMKALVATCDAIDPVVIEKAAGLVMKHHEAVETASNTLVSNIKKNREAIIALLLEGIDIKPVIKDCKKFIADNKTDTVDKLTDIWTLAINGIMKDANKLSSIAAKLM